MSKKMIRSFAAFALVLCMLLTNLGGWNLALAEETQVEKSEEVKETNETKEEPQVKEEEHKDEPQGEEPQLENKENELESKEVPKEGDGLEISDEIISGAVEAGTLEALKINDVASGSDTITGSKLKRENVDGTLVVAELHVILQDKNGTQKAKIVETPRRGGNWKVTLENGVKAEAGDKVIAWQKYNGQESAKTEKEVQSSLAGQYESKLKMPTGEIWIEQTSSNNVNDDEQDEAVKMFNNVNTAISEDIKSVEFSIDGTNHAYYEVTYTDDSTSKVEATGLTIKQVTEYSRAAVLGSITIVDNVIKGKLSGAGPFDGIKVQILLKLSDAVKDSYCDGGKCSVDKDTSDPVDATVNGETGEFTYTIPNPDLKLDQAIGVTVKEPHKFKSCSKTTVIAPIPEKTDVKDPKKLTAEDKGKIIEAIKTAYIVDGKSKLPNGTGDYDGVPAVIQIDDDGNAKIFKGNDVKGTWDPNNNYKFIPETNDDGSYKLKDNVVPKITIQAKDLVKNKAPESPKVMLSDDKKNITITPNLELDTDAKIIAISYTGSDDTNKTIKAARADDGTWSITEGQGLGTVDANGVITLDVTNVKVGTKVNATVSDKGGIADDDKKALKSEATEFKITKAILVEALGGLDPVVMKKWVDDKLSWKDGVKAKDSATDDNKGKIKEILDETGTKFTDETTKGRNTDTQGDYTGKIKVKFDDDSEIIVEKQMLYVSNHVTSVERKDKVPTDALDVEFKLGEGTKVDNTGSGAIEGNKTNPTSYAKYKVKPNTNLKDEKLPGLNTSVVDSIKLTEQDGYTEPTWNTNNFVATTSNNVFTATATKTFKVTVKPNEGTGDDVVTTVKKDGTYTLPAADTFTAPNENQEFSGWQVGDDSKNLKKAGDTITITTDTTVKAIWKPIEFKVSFNAGEGSGTMNEVTVTKGSEYQLPANGFTAPNGKEFAGWKVGNENEVKKAGDTIKITDNVTLTATWKDKPAPPPAPNPGSGSDPDYRPHRPHRPSRPDNDTKKPDTNTPDNKTPEKPDDNKKVEPPKVEKKPDGTTEVTPNSKDDTVKIVGKDKDGKPIDVVVEKDKDGKWHVDKDSPVSVDPKTGKITIAKGVKDIKAKSIIRLERGTHYRYIYGYPDGTVRPEGLITRAEAAALIARVAMLDMSDKAKPNFKDTPSMWYNSAINVVVKKNLMLADDGKFRPNEAITRAEFARALFYIDAKNATVAPFADVKGHKFEEAINQAYGNGRIAGYPDGTFRPDAFIKRAEAAKILNHYAKRSVDHDGMKGVEVYTTHFTDLNERYWGYYEIMEAANTHEYERRVNTILETWTKINNK